jgi:hypothetical protein
MPFEIENRVYKKKIIKTTLNVFEKKIILDILKNITI